MYGKNISNAQLITNLTQFHIKKKYLLENLDNNICVEKYDLSDMDIYNGKNFELIFRNTEMERILKHEYYIHILSEILLCTNKENLNDIECFTGQITTYENPNNYLDKSKKNKKKIKEYKTNTQHYIKSKIKFHNIKKLHKYLEHIIKSTQESIFRIMIDDKDLAHISFDYLMRSGLVQLLNNRLFSYIIYDTNFIINIKKGNQNYKRLYQGIESKMKNYQFIKEHNFVALQKEKAGGIANISFDQLKKSFQEEINQFIFHDNEKKYNRNSQIVQNLIGLSIAYFERIINTFINLKDSIGNVDGSNNNLKEHLLIVLENNRILDSKFIGQNYNFLIKLWNNLQVNTNKNYLICDWMIVIFSLIINIICDPQKCIIISDDEDLQVIYQIFVKYIIPNFIVDRIYAKFQSSFENEQQFNEYIINNGLINKEILFQKFVDSVKQLNLTEYFQNIVFNQPEIQKTEIGLILIPRNKQLLKIFLSDKMIRCIYADEGLICELANAFIISILLNIDLTQIITNKKLSILALDYIKKNQVIIHSRNQLKKLL